VSALESARVNALIDFVIACAVLVVPLYAAYIAVRWIAQHSRGSRAVRQRRDGES
jgi:hypothetical protein